MSQQYREVKRLANVGERIRVVEPYMADGRYSRGSEFIVREIKRGVAGSHDNVRVAEFARCILDSEYVVLEPIQPDFPEVLTQFMRENAAAIRKYLDEIAPRTLETTQSLTEPKPLTRAEIIAKAKADVAELERIGRDDDSLLPERCEFYGRWFEVDFVVNRNKRAVTALIYVIDGVCRTFARISRKPDAKGFAKAAPGDVFNADIGKAIAVRRALGLTVPDDYLNASQPDEPRVGMIADSFSSFGVVTLVAKARGGARCNREDKTVEPSLFRELIGTTILDDTDVDYSAETERSAA